MGFNLSVFSPARWGNYIAYLLYGHNDIVNGMCRVEWQAPGTRVLNILSFIVLRMLEGQYNETLPSESFS